MFSIRSSAPSSPTFPTYLLQSIPIPFRRRKQSSSTTASSSLPASDTAEGTSDAGAYYTALSTPLTSPPTTPTSPATAQFPSFRSTNQSSHKHGESVDEEPLGPTSWEPAPQRLCRTGPDLLRCKTCSTDLAFNAQIVSKGFTGRHGRAYLVSPVFPPSHHLRPSSLPANVSYSTTTRAAQQKTDSKNLVNIRVGKPESRQLVTGAHVVADIHCAVCSAKIGWKYVDAKEAGQKYKVGKFILETAKVVKVGSFGDVDAELFDDELHNHRSRKREGGGGVDRGVDVDGDDDDDDEVVFDSEDEDECEDVFMGIWNREETRKRRARRDAAARTKPTA